MTQTLSPCIFKPVSLTKIKQTVVQRWRVDAEATGLIRDLFVGSPPSPASHQRALFPYLFYAPYSCVAISILEILLSTTHAWLQTNYTYNLLYISEHNENP